MVNKKGYTPQHCQHRRSGRGYVLLDGKQIPTGAWGTPEAEQKANELISRWLANGRKLPPEAKARVYRVEDLVAEFWTYAQEEYQKHGKPTGETHNVRDAIRPLLQHFGSKVADEFSPLDLEELQKHLDKAGNWSRSTINSRINIVKRIFRWGARRMRISGNTVSALREVPPIKFGKLGNDRETKPKKAVKESAMLAVLPHVPPPVAAMIQLQWLSGMRPGEVVQMRWADIDRSEEEWCFRPQTHKLEHLGKTREVWLGPRAQALLRQWLQVDQNKFIFSPRAADAIRREEIRASRKRPMSASQRRRDAKRRRNPRLKERYTTNSYLLAIRRACDSAKIPSWSPNQLRKATATRVRKVKGLDGAQVVLGHSHASTTEIYADLDAAKARTIAHELG